MSYVLYSLSTYFIYSLKIHNAKSLSHCKFNHSKNTYVNISFFFFIIGTACIWSFQLCTIIILENFVKMTIAKNNDLKLYTDVKDKIKSGALLVFMWFSHYISSIHLRGSIKKCYKSIIKMREYFCVIIYRGIRINEFTRSIQKFSRPTIMKLDIVWPTLAFHSGLSQNRC